MHFMKDIQAHFGASLNVHVDAQIEKHDADEGGEELQGGGCHEEIPVVEKLSIAFPIRDVALACDVFPADNCRSVKQEG